MVSKGDFSCGGNEWRWASLGWKGTRSKVSTFLIRRKYLHPSPCTVATSFATPIHSFTTLTLTPTLPFAAIAIPPSHAHSTSRSSVSHSSNMPTSPAILHSRLPYLANRCATGSTISTIARLIAGHPLVPLLNANWYFSSARSFSSQRSGRKRVGSGKMAPSRKSRGCDMLIGVPGGMP